MNDPLFPLLQQTLLALDTLPVDGAGQILDPSNGVIGYWQLDQSLDLAVAVLSQIAEGNEDCLTYDELQRLLNAKAEKLPDRPHPDDPVFDPPGMSYASETDRLIARRVRYNLAREKYRATLAAHQTQAAHAEEARRRYGYGRVNYLAYAEAQLTPSPSVAEHSHSQPPAVQTFLTTPRRLPIPEASARYGTFIVGNHGSGKSEVIKHRVWHYLTKPTPQETVIVIDPHGEMAPEIARLKPNFDSDRLVYIDPTLAPPFVPCPRVLSTDDKSVDNLFHEAEQYGEALRMISGSIEPSVSGNMESICRNCAHVVLEHDHYNLKNLMELLAVELPKKDRPQREVPPIYRDACEHSPSPAIREHFSHGFLYGNYGMAKNALLGRVERIVAAPVLQRMLLSAPTFDLAKLIDQRKVIVINLPMGQLTDSVTAMVGQLLMAQIVSAVLKRDLPNIDDYPPVHVFLDEAQHFVSHATAKQINELRKYGFSLTLATQYVDQFPSAILEAVKGLGIQIAGYCTGKNLTAMNAVFDLNSKTKDEDETTRLQRQSVGQFHFRARGAPGAPEIKTRPFTTATSLLYKGDEWREANAERYMTEAEWEETKAQQLARYYRPVTIERSADATLELVTTNADTQAPRDVEVEAKAPPDSKAPSAPETTIATTTNQPPAERSDDLPPLKPTRGHG